VAVPLSTRQRIQATKRKNTNGEVIVKVSGVKKAEAQKYNGVLRKLTNTMAKEVENELASSIKSLQPEYVSDAYAEILNGIMLSLSSRWRNITPLAKQIAEQFVTKVDTANQQAFYGAIQKVIGINLNGIIQTEGINDILQAKIAENVGLIQSIPDQYFKSLVTIVNEGTTRGNRASSMFKEIRKLNGQTRKRAKVIARDQTQKVNSAITQARQESLGVVKYRWRTSNDERVRATHKAHNGKVFRWDRPPKDTGHPGQDIQCRCVAEPILDL
tara:strand:- start:1137 stop:1952 length:816 start_codon:yes stop_codon:yes gene_type:complete